MIIGSMYFRMTWVKINEIYLNKDDKKLQI